VEVWSLYENRGKPEVLVIGDILLDSQYWVQAYPVHGGDVAILAAAPNAGGSAANTAVALRSQNISCAFHGRVGNDDQGKQLSAQMEQLGIDLSCLDVCGSTGYTVTMIDPSGERTMFSHRATGEYLPRLTPALREMLKTVKVVYVSGYHLAEAAQAAFVTEVAKAAQAAGCLVMLDTAPIIGNVEQTVLDEFLAYTDALLPNRDELFTMAGTDNADKAIEIMLRKVPCLAVKLGAKGARLAAKPGLRLADGTKLDVAINCTIPAEKVTPVDTTGAGDSFNAGFVAAFLQGGSPESWLASGNRLAAKAIAHRGAISCYLD
jgi:sugar/nucleoside kinase (ribokinase family)